MVISAMLILSLFGGYFSIDHVTLFEQLFRSYTDMRHHMLCHFPTWFIVEKSSVESLDSLLALDSRALLLRVSS